MLHLQRGEDVVINRVARERLPVLAEVGHDGLEDGLETPVLLRVGEGRAVFVRCVGARVGRAHADPRFEVGDLRGGKFLVLRRHLESAVAIADGADERAGIRIAGDDGGAGIAALEQAVARIEAQAALDAPALGGMALVAILHQHGPDFLLEEIRLLLRELGRGRGAQTGGEEQQQTGCAR